jgi:hypothetical protein
VNAQRANRTARLTFAALALCGSVAAAAARPPPRGHAIASAGSRYLESLPVQARTALERDAQVVLDEEASSSGPALLRAVVRFDRPLGEVYALLTQPAEQHTYLPHVGVSRQVGERTPEGERDDFEISFPLVTFKYRIQHWFYPEEHRVEWDLDPTADNGLEEELGFWQLYELDDGTTVGEYGTRVRARDGLVNLVRTLGQRGAVTETLTALRRHVHSALRH